MSAAASTSKAQDIDLQAETFRRLHPRAYLERFLNEGFRPDGREIGDWRDASVNVGKVLVSLFNLVITECQRTKGV